MPVGTPAHPPTGKSDCPRHPAAPNRASFALVALALIVSGCGYTQVNYSGDTTTAADGTTVSKTRSLYRSDVKTVAVPIFTNRTFERNIEFNLSKAIVNYIESNTPYKVVPKERADTILEGEIIRYDVRTSTGSPYNSLPQEQLTMIRCNFTWKDMRNGRILAERRHFDQTGTNFPTLGEGRYIGDQQQVERLAIAIVQELQTDW